MSSNIVEQSAEQNDVDNDVAIRVSNLSKVYQIYERPQDRLKQSIVPRLQRMIFREPRRYYSEFWALNDVSLEVKKGETVGIIGRNGAGKSTILQIICGTLAPTYGSVETTGRVAALLELGSGFNPEYTGRENVYMNGAVLGLNRDEIDDRYVDIERFAEIGKFIDQPVKTYSSGMVVRLAFAVAINVNPEILIVDEALAVGDELFQRKCFSRIEEIRLSGATILFVSHSGAQIIELCNRAILMDAGDNIMSGQPKDVVSQYFKLLNAPEYRKAELRAEIVGKSGQSLSTNSVGNDRDVLPHCSATPEKENLETFDPNLIPGSTIEYESHGPVIDLPQLRNFDGQQVNGLIRGRRYRYCYRVVFHKSASQVRFGMSIKTTTGFSLGGALSAPTLACSIPYVAKGKTVDVEFSFFCHLNPGIYFMNAGVFGRLSDHEIVLHRRADIIAFRVLPITENIETEVVSFGFDPRVSLNA